MLSRSLLLVVLLAAGTATAAPVAAQTAFDRDCADFTTHQAAQTYFEERGGSAFNNVDNLDADHDGIACELLPRGLPQFQPPTPTRRPAPATRVPPTVPPTPTAPVGSTIRPTPTPRRTAGATTSSGDDTGGGNSLLLWAIGAAALLLGGVVWLARQSDADNAPAVYDTADLPPLRLSKQPPAKPTPIARPAAPLPQAMRPQTGRIGYDTTTMPYRDYLTTPEWWARRTDALRRADYRCQMCNRADRLDVHHRTYDRRGREAPEDLFVLCRPCHDRHHDRLPRPPES